MTLFDTYLTPKQRVERYYSQFDDVTSAKIVGSPALKGRDANLPVLTDSEGAHASDSNMPAERERIFDDCLS